MPSHLLFISVLSSYSFDPCQLVFYAFYQIQMFCENLDIQDEKTLNHIWE
jgi:hypothetical protein